MTNDAKCEDAVSASQTLTCGSSRNSTASECDGIEVDTDRCTSSDRNCSSHCSTSDESADIRKSLIDLHMVKETNENIKISKFPIYSKWAKWIGMLWCACARERQSILRIQEKFDAQYRSYWCITLTRNCWNKQKSMKRINKAEAPRDNGAQIEIKIETRSGKAYRHVVFCVFVIWWALLSHYAQTHCSIIAALI